MVRFDETKQEQQLKTLREQEEERLVQTMADKRGLSYIDMASVAVSPRALGILTEEEARGAGVAPFQLRGKNLSLAVLSPSEESVQAMIKKLSESYAVETFMASHASMEKIWARYKDASFAKVAKAGVLDISNASVADIVGAVHNTKDIKKLIDELMAQKVGDQTTKLFKVIIAGALVTDASDIHIEAEEKTMRLRYRIDGVLQDVTRTEKKGYRMLVARIKLLSGMRLNVSGDMQDGRFSVKIKGTEIDMRVSILPSSYGESVVMRVLNPEAIKVSLEELGIEKKLFAIIEKQIEKPKGMVLNTGPTGSGKTTSLYAFLRRIYTPEIKIITIEDPIEYHLDGVSQTQVSQSTNYTFLSGLRAALRQDPDVIMVGEIRDEETAQIAINSALTGHLVFSSLHTNNAAGTIPRLLDLKVNPKVIAAALNIAIAQRLVRKLCASCKQEYKPEDAERALVERILEKMRRKRPDAPALAALWRAPGCDVCNETGYKGRIGIYEAILVDAQIEKLITLNPSEREIREAAVPQGILDMREDGILKALTGVTSIEEVGRVVDLEEDL